MIVYKFDKEKIKELKSVEDAFALIGISVDDKHEAPYSASDKDLFGPRVNFWNLVVTDKTYTEIYEQLKPLGKKRYNRAGQRMPSGDALQWANYGPMSSGPRLKDLEKELGEPLEDYTLYIIVKGEELYKEAPDVE